MSSINDVNNSTTGQEDVSYWRNLDEYDDREGLLTRLSEEFPGYDPQSLLTLSRRRFMQLSAAAMAMAGLTLTGCRRWPEEKLAPFAARPDGYVPGERKTYATIMTRGGCATGLLVSQIDGRPIKIEGNPLHPSSLGATDIYHQASLLDMYDPGRSRAVRTGRGIGRLQASWRHFRDFIHTRLNTPEATGRSIAVLSPPDSSPSLRDMKNRLTERYPDLKWYRYEPVNRDNDLLGTRRAFGRPLRAQYQVNKAKVIVCIDCDLLGGHPMSLSYARQWSERRKTAELGRMNRLYAIEPTFTITGSVADHRLPLSPTELEVLISALAVKLGVMNDNVETASAMNQLSDDAGRMMKCIADDLALHPGTSLVCAGPGLSPDIHALIWAINHKLGNIGRTVTFTEEPAYEQRTCGLDIASLTRRMHAGDVETLLILGGNPVYDAPADLDFAGALDQMEHTIHLGMYENETGNRCTWHLPMAHSLECWGDGEAWDGTFSIQQPLILPLYDGKSAIEVLAMVLSDDVEEGYDIVRRTFRGNMGVNGQFDKLWRHVLHEGVIRDSGYATITPEYQQVEVVSAAGPARGGSQTFEVQFIPSGTVHDGRYANNAWLQELPDPLTKVTWNNPARMHIDDASKLGVKHGEVIRIRTDHGIAIDVPVYLMPGQAKGCISLSLGYGRSAAGDIGNGVGTNVHPLRTGTNMHYVIAGVEKTGQRITLAETQQHHLIDWIGREITEKRIGKRGHSGKLIKETSLKDYIADPEFLHREEGGHSGKHSLQLWDSPHEFNDPHAWGMAIDLNACIGCNACVAACQAENNIPVVGENQVLMHREMHWIRIDRYFKGDPAGSPDIVHQPMMCTHCENAPCEQVCPVAATVHDTEGLNTMVYNRCIGTRYCSNNCPFKVRRFNYFDYHSKHPRESARPWFDVPDTQQKKSIDPLRQMGYNPQVTVRMRGVMEKCTYCVQRLARAKIDAKNAFTRGRRSSDVVRDGEVQTACQQACPTEAIVFGDLNDPDSRVSRLQRSNRSYSMLTELNLRTRTKYLAKIRNRDANA